MSLSKEHVANRSQGNLLAVTWRVRGRTGCGHPWAAFRPCAPNLYALQPLLMGHWEEVGRKWVEKGQRVFQKEKLMWIKGQRRATKGPPTGRLPASLIAVEVCAGKEDTEHPFSAWNIFLSCSFPSIKANFDFQLPLDSDTEAEKCHLLLSYLSFANCI